MPIDFTIATPKQVIERSHLMHPSLFEACLMEARDTHCCYAAHTTSAAASSAAANMAHDCERVLLWLQDSDIDGICADISCRTIALTEALRLQCVPRSLWAGIASR